jgi:endonuclease YncB( thermonuclease family)
MTKPIRLALACALALCLAVPVGLYQAPKSADAASWGWQLSSGRWWYATGDSWYTGWHVVGNKWYRFDASGWMETGWVKSADKWYYLDAANGDMKTGWMKTGGTWYYLNAPNGDMATGWITDKGKTYYLSGSGAMVIGTQVIEGVGYTFDGSGALVDTGGNTAPGQDSQPGDANQRGRVIATSVSRIYDGDTFYVPISDVGSLSGLQVKYGKLCSVRLIAANCAELNTEQGKRDLAYVKKTMPVGTKIWLELDRTQVDDHGRLLAYVWLQDPVVVGGSNESVKDWMLNGNLLYKGHADPKYFDLAFGTQNNVRYESQLRWCAWWG